MNKPRLLVLDDDRVILMCIEMYLKGFYELILEKDPNKAVEIVKKEHLDGILLDVNFPYVKGAEVVRKLKELSSQTPILIVSGYSRGRGEIEEAFEAGADGYLRKPFVQRQILEAVDRLLKGERGFS